MITYLDEYAWNDFWDDKCYKASPDTKPERLLLCISPGLAGVSHTTVVLLACGLDVPVVCGFDFRSTANKEACVSFITEFIATVRCDPWMQNVDIDICTELNIGFMEFLIAEICSAHERVHGLRTGKNASCGVIITTAVKEAYETLMNENTKLLRVYEFRTIINPDPDPDPTQSTVSLTHGILTNMGFCMGVFDTVASLFCAMVDTKDIESKAGGMRICTAMGLWARKGYIDGTLPYVE